MLRRPIEPARLSILTVSFRTFEVYKSEDWDKGLIPTHGTCTESGPKAATTEVKLNRTNEEAFFMLKSYRWIVGCTLVVGFLGGTFVYAKSAELQQQVSKRNRDNTTALTFGSHVVGPFYAGKRSYGLADRAENNLFDIFCSAVDTEWLRPDQNSSTPALQRLRGLGPKRALTTRRRYQLRPC